LGFSLLSSCLLTKGFLFSFIYSASSSSSPANRTFLAPPAGYYSFLVSAVVSSFFLPAFLHALSASWN
jgi:hypothetical protein